MSPEETLADRKVREAYRALRRDAAFTDLLTYISETRERQLKAAEDSIDVQNSYGLLKSAQACKMILSYVESMSEPEQ